MEPKCDYRLNQQDYGARQVRKGETVRSSLEWIYLRPGEVDPGLWLAFPT